MRFPMRTGQLADELGVSGDEIRRAIDDGYLERPATRMGRWYWWQPSEIDDAEMRMLPGKRRLMMTVMRLGFQPGRRAGKGEIG